MTHTVIDRLDLYVSVHSDDGDHEIPDTFFPAPKHFVRSAEKPIKVVLRLQTDTDSDDKRQEARHLQFVSNMKTAMGKDLSESCEKSRWSALKSQRTNNEWDLILDQVSWAMPIEFEKPTMSAR